MCAHVDKRYERLDVGNRRGKQKKNTMNVFNKK
jgi:hypothetical protein